MAAVALLYGGDLPTSGLAFMPHDEREGFRAHIARTLGTDKWACISASLGVDLSQDSVIDALTRLVKGQETSLKSLAPYWPAIEKDIERTESITKYHLRGIDVVRQEPATGLPDGKSATKSGNKSARKSKSSSTGSDPSNTTRKSTPWMMDIYKVCRRA
jgi:hypothetical protein